MLIDNNGNADGYTDGPPEWPGYTPNECRRAVFLVRNGGRMRLTDEFTVGDLWLETADAWLDLDFNTMHIKTQPHGLGAGKVINQGAIVCAQGTLILVR